MDAGIFGTGVLKPHTFKESTNFNHLFFSMYLYLYNVTIFKFKLMENGKLSSFGSVLLSTLRYIYVTT